MSIQVTSSLTSSCPSYYKTDLGRLAEIDVKLWPSARLQQMRQVRINSFLKQKSAKKLTKLLLREGRVIVTAAASNLVHQQVFDSAADHGRRVVLTGFDVENIVRTAIRLKIDCGA